jgi:putative transposase
MPRIARIVIADVPYHVTQRGNNRQDVFLVDDDRRVYLELLADYASRFGLDVLGYSLMTNHVHLVAVPRTEKSLALAMGRTDFRYAQHVNRFHRREGHLWQNRFYSCALDEKHAVAALRYVEQNPVRARLTRVPWTYEWSSAAAHVGEGDQWGLLDLKRWRAEWSPQEWRRMVSSDLDASSAEEIRRHTARGRPLGSDSFVSKVEHLLGRRVRPLPVGRPQGWKKKRKDA